MRLFAHSYADVGNLVTTFQLGVFGARDDQAGLGTKIRALAVGDLLLIRLTGPEVPHDGPLKFAPLCRVVGPVFDQRVTSPFRDYLWPDEQMQSAVLYPLRCAIEQLALPIRNNDVSWSELDSLGLRNQDGEVLLGRQMWGPKLRGNFFTEADSTSVLKCISLPV